MNLTDAQLQAVAAKGNTLVLAGAGTGKTRTMVSRCLDRLFRDNPPGSLDRVLMVTFTEAAAAEMKERIQLALEEKLHSETHRHRAIEQLTLLTSARIGTLHSLALHLIRDHATELGLSQSLRVLSTEESFQLSETALDEVFDQHYAQRHSKSRLLCRQIDQMGQGTDRTIRHLVLRIHHYAQSLAEPDRWFAQQLAAAQESSPTQWRRWMLSDLVPWIQDWSCHLQDHAPACSNLNDCLGFLNKLQERFQQISPGSAESFGEQDAFHPVGVLIHQASETDLKWARGEKTRFRQPFETLYADLHFLASIFPPSEPPSRHPLQEDWHHHRAWIKTLIQLTQEFNHHYTKLKTQSEGLDFHDLEQLTLTLLTGTERQSTTAIAQRIRDRYDHVFVDEYQDINGAQDAIIKGLARPHPRGNLFIVGDVKQSIYRFRRANPNILNTYEHAWTQPPLEGTRVYLQSNFRSRAQLIHLINHFCTHLSSRVEGFHYPDSARLTPGQSEGPPDSIRPSPGAPPPSVELHLLKTPSGREIENPPDSPEIHRLAQRLVQLMSDPPKIRDASGQCRILRWSDIAILLRTVSERSKGFARILSRYRIPVQASLKTFFELPEVNDLIALLKVIDNPLQDIPLLALLRSPFLGFTTNELALIRLASPQGRFWRAIQQFPDKHQALPERIKNGAAEDPTRLKTQIHSTLAKCEQLLSQHQQWRRAGRAMTVANQIETILATEYYVEYMSSLHPERKPEASLQQLIRLARDFQRQPEPSLSHFLRWLDALAQSGFDVELGTPPANNAVQLMSIHKSKGLEFPVVVLADLEKGFNTRDLSDSLIIDETYGLCSVIALPDTAQTYPSLAHWFAQKNQRGQLIDEEARLLYVAMTRAKEKLILVASGRQRQIEETWRATDPRPLDSLKANQSFADWLVPWCFQMEGTGNGVIVQQHDGLAEGSDKAVPPGDAPDPTELPEDLSAGQLEQLNARLGWAYPSVQATLQPAKVSVSRLNRHEEPMTATSFPHPAMRPDQGGSTKGLRTGLAYHRILQWITPVLGSNLESTRGEVQRLIEQGIIVEADVTEVQLERIVAFWTSDVGEMIRAESDRLHRELPFTARFAVEELQQLGFDFNDDAQDPKMRDWVILQGVIDLAVLTPGEIWLLDFKSERIDPSQLNRQLDIHRPQLMAYQSALERIYHRPVVHCWIHFLQSDTTHDFASAAPLPKA